MCAGRLGAGYGTKRKSSFLGARTGAYAGKREPLQAVYHYQAVSEEAVGAADVDQTKLRA
jgi:hypothetical protein